MKIEVNANPFCPDNCKHYKQKTECLYGGEECYIRHEGCMNEEICRYAYNLNPLHKEECDESI